MLSFRSFIRAASRRRTGIFLVLGASCLAVIGFFLPQAASAAATAHQAHPAAARVAQGRVTQGRVTQSRANPQAPALKPDFSCLPPPSTSYFEYCNNSAWITFGCSTANHNGTNGAYNVYYTNNRCGVRVWLHQYTDWSSGGWSYCLSPGQENTIPSGYQHPYNVYVSDNGSFC